MSRNPLRWIAAAFVFLIAAFLFFYNIMPISQHPTSSEIPPFPEDAELRGRLESHIDELAVKIGERNIWRPYALGAAGSYIRNTFSSMGFEVVAQPYVTDGVRVENLEIELPGTGSGNEIVIIGAHYDSVIDCPGANDNGSGIAALLEIARWVRALQPARTLRLVAFVNEEPPFFQTDQMGSRVYARRCRGLGEDVVAMLSLETIGYYSDKEGSQNYPFPFSLFYPSTGNFVGFVGNVSSRALVRKVKADFKKHTVFPCEAAAVPGAITGIGWSDHWSFWEEGYPALMVTDTALFRYDEYHTHADTPDKMDFEGFTQVVKGLMGVTAELVGGGKPSDER
jgi:hypothetical protein